MSDYVIYHNPRCSKSRATLALLEEHGIEPAVELYLVDTLGEAAIGELLAKLKLTAAQLVRRSEADYKAAGLDRDSTEAQLVAAMAVYPKLIERPIVVRGDQAVLGRPPENVLALLD